ncbi:MAG: N-acetylglucosamine-6-phosphate deacetylase [Ruegeria sp.]
MTQSGVTYSGGPIFDGQNLLGGYAITLGNGRVIDIGPAKDISGQGELVDLGGDIIAPGYVDLQVNGGDGVMLNDDPSPETLVRMARAHGRLGTGTILPTLITDTREKTHATIEAAKVAIRDGLNGIGGLHLEGPHLSVARKGAHDPNLIRPMEDTDLQMLVTAARELPALMITIAPESTTLDQVRALSKAGVVVSLGHTDADFSTCMRYAMAGARCATHLFNAMSQLNSREPGLVGAVLSNGDLSAGLIADGIHVHPQTMRAAFDAKTGPGEIFLVSDAMAPAGTDIGKFELEGRRITRSNGRLTLSDGTLAGADLDLTTAIRVLVNEVGVGLSDALRAASSIPARLAGLPGNVGAIQPDKKCDVIRISSDLTTVRNVGADFEEID